MSFRHTYITEYLYKAHRQDELEAIRKALDKWGTVDWVGQGQGASDIYGYFHGVIKDSNSFDTKRDEQQIIDELEKAGCKIKIIFE